MSKSLGIWLDSIDERSMVRSLHTQDPSVSEVGGDLHFRSFRTVISMKLVT